MPAIITSMTSVFNAVFTWFASALETVTGVLYVNDELTLLGILCIVGLSISLFLLVFNILKSCFNLR